MMTGTSGLMERIAAVSLLRASDVHKSFGLTPALRGADLAVGAGEVLAIMGPSGSGKSTLMHCLAGILRPDSGQISYDGRRVDEMADAGRTVLRRTEFGFVFQFGQLVAELTAVENVALPLLLGGAKRRAAWATATQWLATLGLAGLEDRRPGELSGGQAQRVAVARAMVTGPKVIFADEPTGSLDSEASESVLRAFTDLARSHGTSVVIVTHADEVAAYADRIVVVRDGVVLDAAEAEVPQGQATGGAAIDQATDGSTL
jgi:putative ABC transport system ATP-binding protein